MASDFTCDEFDCFRVALFDAVRLLSGEGGEDAFVGAPSEVDFSVGFGVEGFGVMALSSFSVFVFLCFFVFGFELKVFETSVTESDDAAFC